MRIKTQFIICIIVFTIVLVIIAASVANTEQQTAYFANQQVISSNIERGASSLNSVSIDYFLYQEDLQLSKWNSTLSSLSSDLQSLDVKGDRQQMLAGNVERDLQNLNVQFEEVANYLQDSPRDVSVRIDPAFQFRWSNMALQSQTLASDASQLSQSINDQVHQTSFTNILLILLLVGTFGAFLLAIYFLVFRRTLKSVAGLQKGINSIGKGKLDYKIEIHGQNEITELSNAFNEMTSDLKAVTASKSALEKEIMERRKAEEEVKESEERFAKAFMANGSAMSISRLPEGIWVNVNDRFVQLTGYSREELIGHTSVELGLFSTDNPDERKRIIESLQKNNSIDDSPIRVKTKNGESRNLIQSIVKVSISGQPYAVVSLLDVTERKKAEEALLNTQQKLEENAVQLEEYAGQMEALAEQRANKLKDAERLAAIGATAGMVGHDIRNPLQAIISDVFLAKTELASIPDSEEKKNALESMIEIENNIDYINKIVQDLQDYARPLNPKIEESDLESIIDSIIAKNCLPTNIKTTIKISDDVRTIRVDSYFLNRILLNLVTNAVQAMQNGGELAIDAHKDAGDTVLSVKDTGVGIPREIHDKMFTLMFTTKSKGQGFGLPVVKRMTESLGGTVTFESTEGKGTTFIVRLPLQGAER